MVTLPREYLDDISTQRFQENVARDSKRNQSTINSNTSAITANTTAITTTSADLAALQAVVSGLPSVPTLGYSQGQFVTASLVAGFSGNVNIPHTLGVVPLGWWLVDFIAILPIYRVSWTSSAIVIFFDNSSGPSATAKLYLVA